MKNFYFTLLLCLSFTIGRLQLNAQCIEDIRYLIDHPSPCFFIGTVKTADPNCFDPFAFPLWRYKWIISGADDGEVIATYDGLAFGHTFTKFGGYEFCLEVDKDGLPGTPPDIRECITYTTCEFCGGEDISFEYLDCPVTMGCNVLVSAEIEAVNAWGIKPFASYVMTYYPTAPELAGGAESYDIVFNQVPVTYHPLKGTINISDNVTIPFSRGCYKPKIIFNLEWGVGAHSVMGGPACEQLAVEGKEMFRCIACNDNRTGCNASVLATEISNLEGTCEPWNCFGKDETDGRSDDAVVDGAAPPAHDVNVYPNPAYNMLFIDLPQQNPSGWVSVRLFNTIGQMQVEKSLPARSQMNLDISALNPGAYYLHLDDGAGTTIVRKIIILK
ncbi:MAG: T9SS type A sorting domain-containing protein [Saprospiraceae bacterium]|nr:MAG: T9SS type A sorting domain-containing protein [Saprospiraceae bacterium]